MCRLCHYRTVKQVWLFRIGALLLLLLMVMGPIATFLPSPTSTNCNHCEKFDMDTGEMCCSQDPNQCATYSYCQELFNLYT